MNQSHMQKFRKILEKAGMDEKPHQVEGVQWCLEKELAPDARGGFIADEMGLGKTLTMIATCYCNFRMPTLIVLPVSLLQQWHDAIFRCLGHKAAIFHGKERNAFTREMLEKRPIVLTTYGLIETSLLHEIKWYRVIFDEAHHLRNVKTDRFKAAKKLQAKIRWLVSGTPVQNKKEDFYALCSLLRIPASFYTDTDNINTIREKFVLKRTKQEIGILLPPVHSEKKVVSWTSKLEQKVGGKIHSLLSFSGSNYLTPEELESSELPHRFSMWMRAKQSCILPELTLKTPFIKKSVQTGGAKLASSKIDAVASHILARRSNGNGKIVFSHFKKEIDILVSKLREGGVEKVAVLDGRSSITKKTRILAEKHDVLILQIQTGCEGLNLQADYSEIYFVAPHWNPSIEDQAIARCHRIGQTKPVNVFWFIMDGFDNPINEEGEITKGSSIDDYVTFVQSGKREMSKAFI